MEQAYVVVASGKEIALRLTAAGRPNRRRLFLASETAGQPDEYRTYRPGGGGHAKVYWLENNTESYAFGDDLPYGAHVLATQHASIRRIFADWRTCTETAPDGAGPRTAVRAAEDIIEDMLNLITVVPPKAPPVRAVPRRVRGTVKAFASAGSRAIVELGDGSCCTIQREHVSPPVRLDWMLKLGQSVEGELNDDDKTLDIEDLRTDPRLADLYRSGDLGLALAEQVSARSARFTLYPDQAGPLNRPGSRPTPSTRWTAW